MFFGLLNPASFAEEMTINGAGVFAENVEINLASGSATARATVDAATGRILVE